MIYSTRGRQPKVYRLPPSCIALNCILLLSLCGVALAPQRFSDLSLLCHKSIPTPWRQSGHNKGKNKEKTLEPLQFQGFLWRGRRDLNPRAGFIQPTPLAGEPLRPLGHFRRSVFTFEKLAERVGFEPTGTLRAAGFQDRFLQPLGHLSISKAPSPLRVPLPFKDFGETMCIVPLLVRVTPSGRMRAAPSGIVRVSPSAMVKL